MTANYARVIVTHMTKRRGRPRHVAPDGVDTTKLTVWVPDTLADELRAEAKRRGIAVARVVRERLATSPHKVAS